MPAWVRDEALWARARAQYEAQEARHPGRQIQEPYGYINQIYQQMGGSVKGNKMAKRSRRHKPVARTVYVRHRTPPKARVVYRSIGRRKVGKKHLPPTHAQVNRAATESIVSGAAGGAALTAGLMAIDAYAASVGPDGKPKAWSPPVIGWRGALGGAIFLYGAITKKPGWIVSGVMLVGSALPAAVNASIAAIAGPQFSSKILTRQSLPGIAGKPMGGLPGLIKRAVLAAVRPLAEEEDESEEVAATAAEAIEEVAGELVQGGAGEGGGQG